MLSIRENTDGSRNTARRAFALLLVFVLAFVSFSGALALAAEDAEPPAPKFGDGLRATGGHNITAFIRWALRGLRPAVLFIMLVVWSANTAMG